MKTGSCLCGSINYIISDEIGQVVHCHCKTCQKAHSSAFSSVSAVKDSDFQLTTGALKSYESSEGKRRYFCGQCGSQIYAKRRETEHIILRLGSLDTNVNLQESSHIWVSHKAPWFSFSNDLPKYDKFE
ncbi:GFA family protein [Vibrio amylolyticus]|uniref:GFA family protein n=1 Tax=Vibrio amylolyticus TaxID=2847292 RepID=UPI003552E752